jgi:hypothetical protein
MNARFWVLGRDAGWVKLRLVPGQSLSWSYAYADDEGWSSHRETWRHGGDHVARTWMDDGRDCDGRLTIVAELLCPLTDLSAREFDGLRTPQWVDSEVSQRDEYAEAAGY